MDQFEVIERIGKKNVSTVGLVPYDGSSSAFYLCRKVSDQSEWVIKVVFNLGLYNEQELNKIHEDLILILVSLHSDYVVETDTYFIEPLDVSLLPDWTPSTDVIPDGTPTLFFVCKRYQKIIDRLSDNVSFEDRLKYLLDVLKAMSFLLENNVIHKNIQLPHILYDKEMDCAVLSGFGSAVTVSDMKHYTPESWGAPITRPPEVDFTGGECDGSKLDIWSLGKIAYELLKIDKDTEVKSEIEQLIIDMTNDDPEERITVDDAIVRLAEQI